MKPLPDPVHSHKSGESVGIYSVCSSHPLVLEATLRLAIESHRLAFTHRGRQEAWERVIGLVVQPGVEFDHDKVIDYQTLTAALLRKGAGVRAAWLENARGEE